LIAERLPEATVISIGHRSTLQAFHRHRTEFVAAENGVRHLQAAA
jgi:ABC-type uncharacterized transport system fused permease/ATPase subunit